MSHQSELISEDINEYLKQHEQKELLRLLTCGSVDDGKSTLIGRLLHDSQMIYEDQLEAIKKDSVKSGTNEGEIDLALLVDGLQAEREQGITIDVAYRYFSTARRKFIIADTPGHEQYTRNMATGASTADLAIILIDARQGVLTQTKRHSFIASLLGIKHVVVAINKMDLVDYSEERFNEIKDEYLAFADQLDLQDIKLVPISALKGTNVVSVSEEHTPWYQGQPLMEMLETVQVDGDRNFDDFRLPIQYVNRPNLNFRGFCGTIASGTVKPGDQVLALPSGKSSTVKSIVTYEGELDQAFADQAVTLTLNDEIDISRGDMLVKPDNQPETSNAFSAHIVWMIEDALKPGKLFDIKLGSKVASGSIKDIQHVIDVNTLEQSSADALELNSIALCNLHLNQTLAFDPYKKNRATGAFIIIDRLTNVTVGAGMIHEKIEDHSASDWEPVSGAERHARLNQEPSIVLCQGEAAEALAQAAERKLYNLGRTAVLVTPHMAESAEQAQVIATALKQAGLIAIASSLVDASLANHAISANNDTDIIDAIASLDA